MSAPLRLAEPWDNVGLILDPVARTQFKRAMLTIDWADATLAEAIELEADLVVAYHPPLFAGLKRLRCTTPHERLLIATLEAGITIYSPHTALDAAADGMADWLGRALGGGSARPIVARPDAPTLGAGRFVELDEPVGLDDACERIKAHLGLRALRLSQSPTGPNEIRTFGVCPGAGGSVFERLGACDLLLTGELRHHDILARGARGSHVILTDHTNSERGYLQLWAAALRATCPGLEIIVSQRDADPLVVV